MTYSKQEAEQAAKELISKSIEAKKLTDDIKTLKANLLEYADVENLDNHVWMEDNAFVELKTVVKYKLTDIECDAKVDPHVCAVDIAEKAFATKVYLTKEGKKLFNEQNPSIVKLMIPESKKKINVEFS